ncbi:hypothetical protein KR222_007050, partial [Zaprionus bogoriensis]
FMSSPNDYSLNHDFDEIIRSTVPSLDSSLNLNSMTSQESEDSVQDDNFFSDLFPTTPISNHDLELNLNSLENYSSPCLTEDGILGRSSFNATENFSDLINVCNQNSEIEKLTYGNLLAHTHNRNTPSPTGSCGSSSGSSTSGVHSDSSDVWRNKETTQTEFAPAILNIPQSPIAYAESSITQINDSIQNGIQIPAFSPTVHIQEPIPLYPIEQVQQKVPIVTQASTTIKVESRLEPKALNFPREKLVVDNAVESIGKTKTIYLSSNDYKALMQKMSLNATKGGRINGSVKTQVPKIVMRTGKGQGFQNVGHATSTLNISSPTNLNKNQQPTLHSCGRETYTKEHDASSFIRRSMIDEKMYKKQQRMIKNRESASLSRKKKKEYVVSLETRINNLEKENYTLKGENLTLRNQIVAFAKTCKCRKGNTCELVLHTLGSASKPDQHIKIAPKPTTKAFKQHMNAATVKKNVAVLFAMAFMVTLNAGNFQSYMNKQNLDVADVAVSESSVNEAIPIGRRLLWVESEEEYNEKMNRSNRQTENMVVPPLHFLQPASRNTNVSKTEHWNSTTTSMFDRRSDPPPLTYPTSSNCTGRCATANFSSSNQSEFSRLTMNLQKLINVSGYHNLSSEFDIERDNSHGFKFSTDFLELPNLKSQPSNLGTRKRLVGYNDRLSEIASKQRREDVQNQDKNSFNDSSDMASLFKGIKRKDDTFYVLSFNTQHLLFSPSTFNKSMRPKISFLLPTAEPSDGGDIAMMQVDCEVFNTKEVDIKSHMIPARVRQNVTKWQMRSKHSMHANNKPHASKQTLQDRPEKLEKPRVRTYFMVGPKNQAAAAVSQEKPRFVEFNKGLLNSSRELPADLDP